MSLEVITQQITEVLGCIGNGETFMDAIRDDMYTPESVKQMGATVRTNVRSGDRLVVEDSRPNAESFPFMDLDGGDCKPEACTVDGSIRTPTWDLGLLGCDTEICLLKLPELVLEFFGDWRYTDADLTNGAMQSRIVAYMQSKFIENQILANKRAAFFGDVDSASNLFNGTDGYLKILEAGDNHVEIANNAELTYAEQMMTFEEVVAILDAQYMLLASKPGFNEANYEFRMTNFMATAYWNGLRNLRRNGATLPDGCCVSADDFTRGAIKKSNLAFEDIPIRVDYDLDYLIENITVLNGGGGTNARVNPNISLLARPQDLYIGTTKMDRIGSNKIILDEPENQLILRGMSYFGTLVPFADRVSLAI